MWYPIIFVCPSLVIVGLQCVLLLVESKDGLEGIAPLRRFKVEYRVEGEDVAIAVSGGQHALIWPGYSA
jgi:hypothetical protein